jgi:hypothetical protein
VRRALAVAAWLGGFTAIDMIADKYELSVSELCRDLRDEIGPLAFDFILVGAVLGYRKHVKDQ